MFWPSSTNHPPILRWRNYLAALLLITIFTTQINAFRKPRGRLLGQALLPFGYNFEFTAPEYNVSLKENTRNRPFAQTQPGEKIGIFLPPIFSKIRYKIVEGDRDKLFAADFVVLGDFAFLQIRPEKGQILNRERKSTYELLVKATLKRKNANTLETTTKVNLRILDENDNSPMFRKVEYNATVDTNTPLNSRIIRLEAFDADEGLNAEIYYSSTSPATIPGTTLFYVDSRSGWIRSFAPLTPGVYTIECFVEDRTSRLLFYSASDAPKMYIRNRANATITVTAAPMEPLIVKIEPLPVLSYTKGVQKAGILIVENAEAGAITAEIVSPKGLAWVLSSTSGFDVFIGRTENTPVDIVIAVREVYLGHRFTETKFKLILNATAQKLQFEKVSEITISESTPIGAIVHQFFVNGVFEEEKKNLKFRLRSDATDLPFHMDRESGQLRIRHALDFEKTRSYEFTVHVKLDANEDAKASMPIRVTVLDANDNCPQFTQLPKEHRVVLMTTTIKDPIFTVKATDADSGDNSRILYKFASGSDHGPFMINDGIVSLAKPLPKAQKQWKLNIVATDYGVPAALWTEATIHIFASAVEAGKSKHKPVVTTACSLKNENTPKFAPFPVISIAEDTPVGTVVTQLSATDADFGVNGLIQFVSNDAYFAVNVESGVVTVRQPLFAIFDELNKGNDFIDYPVNVIAIDNAGYVNAKTKSLSIKRVLTVRITNVNNFAPEFELPSYVTTVSEIASPGTELLRVKAIDRDPGTHGRVEYVLAINSDFISVDPDNGAIRLERPFDRELSPRTGDFHFLLGAFDRSDPSRFTFANLTITVTDVNDNAPICGRDVQEFKLLEDAPSGQLVGCLVASDADAGINAELHYTLEKMIPKVPFRVDLNTGCIFLEALNPLSADRHSRYSFNVTVSDGGVPMLSTTCQIKLDLIKVNRNLMAPEFEQVALEASVKENSPIGTIVVTVSARDPEKKAVSYALVGGSGLGYFDIEPVTGVISTAAILDYEATPSFWLTVRATDAEDEPLSAYLSVLVRILDQNDRAPLFEKPIYFTQIAENSPDDTLILRLEAEDADGRDDDIDLRYSITRGNAQSFFHIDPNMGYLVTGKRRLDREAQRQHELTVKVCDRANGKTPLCAEALVIVDVIDKNDNKPLFNTSSNLHVHVPANRVGFLTRIFANDADADGPNSDIEYKFVGPLVDERLRIDAYGRISTVEALKQGSQIHVTVLAQDHGEPSLNNSVTLILEALGRSRKTSALNKAPIFIEKDAWKELYVSDSDPVGVIVGLVRAEDGDNDPLWYNIADDSINPNETFAFKTATGELILARSVNLIDPSISEVVLTVVVSDGIQEVKEQLTIKISRSTTSPRPTFTIETDSITLPSTALAGTVLYTAKATFTEAKSGVSHPHHLVYGIHHVDDVAVRELLRMDSHSGELVLEKSLSSAVAQNFSIILSAKVGTAENYLQLRVSREAANIHTPRFISQHALLSINDPSAINAIVGRVQAFDADKGDVLTYGIISGNELGFFAINNTSGEIRLLKELPHGFMEAILTIRVSDSGSPAKSATAITKLVLKQTPSTRKPVILIDSIQGINVDDEIAVGGSIAAAAIIADAGSLANALAFDGTCEYLDVHFLSGIVRLRKALPKKNTDWNLNCTLFAVNEGGNNATALVSVKISSTLAHSISFPNPVEFGFIEENALPGSSVYTDATEKMPLVLGTSGGRSSKLRILSPRESYFTIDGVSGAIRVVQPIDFEQHRVWHFFVTLNSLGAFPHHVAQPVRVELSIGNANDVAPLLVDQKPMIVLLPPTLGARIGRVEAIDDDGSLNDVTFGLRKSEINGLPSPLEINRTTGEIFVAANSSDAFKQTTIELPVIASDGLHSTNGMIKLTVVDAATKYVPKDGKLRFAQSEYRITVTENTTSLPISLLTADLINANVGEIFRFEILNPNIAFNLSPSLGILSLIDGRSIDREAGPQIDLLIQATSLNEATRSAVAIIHVEIEDINDCTPEFLAEPYIVALSEDAAPGDRILSIKARDRDVGGNSQVRFSLSSDAPKFLEINKFDGRVALKTKHNLATAKKFDFDVIATDSGKPPLQSKATVHVTVVNKFQPIFTHSRYKATVSESAAPGTTVTSVRATAKFNGVVGYWIKAGDNWRQFSMDFNSGTLKVNLPLDREIANTYNLTIEAVDVTRDGAIGTAMIEVTVSDVNDSPPMFEELLYSFQVSETMPIGSLIGRVKAIDSDGSSISYGIAEGNKTILNLDPVTGDIHLIGQLDFEETNFYEMTIVARDSDRLFSEAILQLNVADANDAAPKFLHKSPFIVDVVTNELKSNDFITKVEVSDVDTVASLSDGQRFHFNIVDGDETLFFIVPTTGVIRAAASFVPEQPDIVKKLNVSVTDGIHQEYLAVHVKLHSAVATATVPLHFEQPVYVVTVAENRVPTNSSAIMILEAKGGSGPLKYSVYGDSPKTTIRIDGTSGKVFLTNSIDKKTVVPVVVEDALGRRAFSRLSITIRDENDQTPVFVAPSEGYTFAVSTASQPGEAVAAVYALDADETDVIEYSLIASSAKIDAGKYFEIDSQTGYIVVRNELFELKPLPINVAFTVRASDSGNPPHSSSIDVSVKVVGLPHVPPQPSRLHYVFAISEDAVVGKVIGQIQAVAIDGPSRPAIDFTIPDQSKEFPFTLNEKTGNLAVKSMLDAEFKAKYDFIVQLKDLSTTLQTFALVTVSVVDVNDNAPTFTTTVASVSVREDAFPGTVIGTFVATDADDGANGHVTYSLLNSTVFSIDREFGWLSVAKELDRETVAVYNVVVVAIDDSGKNASTKVVITVEDVNDSPPIFGKSVYNGNVNRTTKPGTNLIKFDVRDSDATGKPSLYIAAGDDAQYFELHRNVLKLARSLSHLSSDVRQFNLTIVAFDGTHSTESLAEISVTGPTGTTISDAICLKNVSKLTIAGNLLPGHVITTLMTGNTDEAVINHLIDGARLPFEIHNHSLLVVKKGYASGKRQFRLKIKSRREKQQPVIVEPSCLQEILVTVENANRVAPKFDPKEYIVKVKEDVNVSADLRHFVLKLDAIDEDAGTFGLLTYSILNATGPVEMFKIDENTGALLLTKPVDYETATEYIVFVKATDGGGLSDVAKIVLQIEDVNDNAPIFEKAVYRLKVLEDEAIGYELIRVVANDSDPEAIVRYSLSSNQSDAAFVKLDSNTGVVTLAKSLDFEAMQTLKIKIIATDEGVPPMTAESIVEIEVLDVNDNAPRFEKTLYEAKLAENVAAGTKVLQVSAKDGDSEHFGKVSYSLSGEDADVFDIDDEGNLLTAKAIDFETKSLLRVNVQAVDGGAPPLSDDTLVSITIDDINDHAPVFGQCPMSAVVQEDVSPGYAVLSATLTDADSAVNGPPFEVKLTGDGAAAFAFDADMRLIVTRKLSHASKPVYELIATATDAKGLSSDCIVTVHVQRQSTHPPEIEPLVVTLTTLHGEFLGGIVGKVKATDKDAGDMLRFALVEMPGSVSAFHASKFLIDSENGDVTVQPDILPGLHRLNVSVTDGKFTVYTRVDVDVSNIDQDALDHAVSLRLKSISATKFVQHFLRRFHEILAHQLGVPTTDVRFLSIQEAEHDASNPIPVAPVTTTMRPHRKFFTNLTATSPPKHALRHRRANTVEPDLDILFTVSRGENHGYHRPPWVRQNIQKQMGTLATESGLEIVSLTSEVCRRDVCVKGECRDRLWLDNASQRTIYDVEGMSYVSPKHVRTFECICKQGYSGRHCDVPINMCSKDLCTKHEMCIPSDDEPSGFRCVCPPGFRGSQCSESTCDDPSSCSQKEELSLMGNGYIQLFVANSMETRLELSFSFKTVSSNAVLMFGEGLMDFQKVEVSNGTIAYTWNCGTGTQSARITHPRVDDGHWHEFKIARRGRHVRVVLDNTQEADATSPAGSDVVNLFHQATILTFGAQVTDPSLMSSPQANTKISAIDWFHRLVVPENRRQSAADLYTKIENGMIGCLAKIAFDGFELSKTAQGMRLFNAKIGCDTSSMGPCLSSPCSNAGQCLPSQNGFTCVCPKRYTGATCEIDLNACESRPCPNGIVCHNLYNDFHCICPTGFTGKTCQLRGDWDPCVTSPCGPYGTCIRSGASFMCNCSNGFGGVYCADRVPNMVPDSAEILSSPFMLAVIALVIIALLLAVILVVVCRKTNKTALLKHDNCGNEYDDAAVMKPLMPKKGAPPPPVPPHGTLTVTAAAAPPLPPRGRGQQGYSNSHTYANSGHLPTVEVRPMMNYGGHSTRLNLSRDSCGSPASSRGCGKRSTNSNLDCSRNYGSAADELEALVKEPRRGSSHFMGADGPPVPARQSNSTSSSRRGSSSTGCAGDISSNDAFISQGRYRGHARSLADSIQCLSTTEEVEIDLDDGDDDLNASERSHMLEDLRRNQQHLDMATQAWHDRERGPVENGEPHDYVTMKPIFKIKPYTVSASQSGDNIPNVDDNATPPPLPAHRNMPTSQSTSSPVTSSQRENTDTTKLYDNPLEDTLSSITSNGLDD